MPARYPIMAVLVTALIAFLIIVAFRAWRSRASQQESVFGSPLEWLEHPSGARQWTAVQYVATTATGDPLNRVTAHGLGARGFGKVTISSDGVLIERNGERAIGIPTNQILSVEKATTTIDRTVESDGLIQVNWSQDGFGLSTFLRARNNEDRKQIFDFLLQITKKEQN